MAESEAEPRTRPVGASPDDEPAGEESGLARPRAAALSLTSPINKVDREHIPRSTRLMDSSLYMYPLPNQGDTSWLGVCINLLDESETSRHQ